MEETMNLEEVMDATAYHERLIENLENNKKVRYSTIRYVPLAMAICYTHNWWNKRTYTEWTELLLRTCYDYDSSFHYIGLRQVGNGLLSLATALECELKNNK
jgi:hypothetical protein